MRDDSYRQRRLRRCSITAAALVAVALAVVLGPVGSSSASSAAEPWTLTFDDPSGDASGAPDLTRVAIDGTEVSGTYTFTASVADLDPVTPDGLEREVDVWLDTDENRSTGSPSGNEYNLYVYVDTSDHAFWGMNHWDGSAWQFVSPSPSTMFKWATDPTWTVNKNDFGGATSFATYVTSITYDSNSKSTVAHDIAPDDGRWLFDLAGPRGKVVFVAVPMIGKPAAVPASVTAGKRVSVSFPVTTKVDGKVKPLTGGKLVGAPSIDGKVIRHSQSFRGGVARLSFVVPKNASGKRLTVKATVKAASYRGEDGTAFGLATGDQSLIATYYVGESATKTATFRIR
jgi:hypothetical protein